MFSFLYVTVVLAITYVNGQNKCNAPAVANVPINELTGNTWYTQAVSLDFKDNDCQTIKFNRAVIFNSAFYGDITITSKNIFSESYRWVNYTSGVVTYSIIDTNYMVFVVYNNGAQYKSFAAYTCSPNNPNNHLYLLLSNVRAFPKTELDNLKQQLNALNGNTNLQYYDINQNATCGPSV